MRVNVVGKDPVNEFTEQIALLAGAFPDIFPFGFVKLSEGPMSEKETIHLLRQFHNIPATVPGLHFLLFNQRQRHTAAQAVNATVNNRREASEAFGRDVVDAAFISLVKAAAEVLPPGASHKDIQEQKKIQRTILARTSSYLKVASPSVPFSALERAACQNKLYSMIHKYGFPNFFYTLTMDDSNNRFIIRLSTSITAPKGFRVKPQNLRVAQAMKKRPPARKKRPPVRKKRPLVSWISQASLTHVAFVITLLLSQPYMTTLSLYSKSTYSVSLSEMRGSRQCDILLNLACSALQ
jgi:hypothetical protein